MHEVLEEDDDFKSVLEDLMAVDPGVAGQFLMGLIKPGKLQVSEMEYRREQLYNM